MKRYFSLIFMLVTSLFFIQSCDSDDTIVGGGFDEPDPLVGCEATEFYDWTDFTFETSLDGGAKTWLGFELNETTLFSINLNQAGFNCAIYTECDGELGSPPPLYSFQTNGNGLEVGIVNAGTYYLEIVNTRPNRLDFEFGISLSDIVYGCMNDDALNYNTEANVDDDSCEFQDCNTDYYLENYGEMVLDCDGNCAPVSWIGDGWCDDGVWAIIDEEGNQVPINLWCAELNFDEGDCEVIDEGCTPGLIEDCNGICAPADWLGDGFCDDGTYEYNGNPIFFNCEEFDNDNGDCEGLMRSNQSRPYPGNRVPVND